MDNNGKEIFHALGDVCSILNIEAADILAYIANHATGDRVITHGLRSYHIAPHGDEEHEVETWYRVRDFEPDVETHLRQYFNVSVLRDSGHTYVNSRTLAALMWFKDVAAPFGKINN